MKLNCTQYQQLRKYDRFLRTAHYANYITGMSLNTANELKAIYEKITGKPFPKNMSCTRCKLDLCKRLGNLYFTYEEARKQKTDSLEIDT